MVTPTVTTITVTCYDSGAGDGGRDMTTVTKECVRMVSCCGVSCVLCQRLCTGYTTVDRLTGYTTVDTGV